MHAGKTLLTMKCRFCQQEGPHQCEHQCRFCRKYFSRKDNRKRHETSCKENPDRVSWKRKRHPAEANQKAKFPCRGQDAASDVTTGEEAYGPYDSSRAFGCKQCGETFPTRRQLHVHKNLQHGGANVDPPWLEGEAPWNVGNQEDEALRAFQENQNIILAPFETNRRNHTIFNIPTNDMAEGMDLLLQKLRQIYNQQTEAFKVSVSLGFILRHIETGEYRYFAPNRNEVFLC